MTSLILFVMNLSGLHLRVTEDEEDKGIDPSEIGYYAYDYITQETETRIVDQTIQSGVWLTRDLCWTEKPGNRVEIKLFRTPKSGFVKSNCSVFRSFESICE